MPRPQDYADVVADPLAGQGSCAGEVGIIRLYRVPEVAEYLSISRSEVYELLKSDELRSVHIDRTRLVRKGDLESYTWA